jgi:hypothetical protein
VISIGSWRHLAFGTFVLGDPFEETYAIVMP